LFPWLRPETGAPHNVEHFIIFAANGFAFGLYSRRPSLIMVALVIFAGAIELVQVLVPGRRARLSDFIIDALAMCIGVAAASIVATRTLERGV
jgi:VanZ family protein